MHLQPAVCALALDVNPMRMTAAWQTVVSISMHALP